MVLIEVERSHVLGDIPRVPPRTVEHGKLCSLRSPLAIGAVFTGVILLIGTYYVIPPQDIAATYYQYNDAKLRTYSGGIYQKDASPMQSAIAAVPFDYLRARDPAKDNTETATATQSISHVADTKHGGWNTSCSGYLDNRQRCLGNMQKLRDAMPDFDSLFLHLKFEEECQNSVAGGVFDYLPQLRSPCWIGMESGTSDKPCSGVMERNRLRLRCLPHAILGGVAKSGTGDLWKAIVRHPNIISLKKELHFWDMKVHTGATISDYADQLDRAAQRLSTAKDQDPNQDYITLEATPAYLWRWYQWQDLPANRGRDEPRYILAHTLRHILPDARLIFLLRNPADRAYSQFRRIPGKAQASLDDFHQHVEAAIERWRSCFKQHTERACAYNVGLSLGLAPKDLTKDNQSVLAPSLYVIYLREWLQIYPRNQAMIIKSEDYYANRSRTVEEIFGFLNLPPAPKEILAAIQSRGVANASQRHGRITDTMWQVTRRLLDQFFGPFNEQLALLLDDERFLWKD